MHDEHPATDEPPNTGTFAHFVGTWLRYIAVLYRPSTLADFQGKTGRHLVPAFGPMGVEEMTAEVIQSWIARRGATAPGLTMSLVGMLRIMWKYAQAWGYAQHNPFGEIRVSPAEMNARYPSIEEAQAMRKVKAKEWQELFLKTVFDAAIRPGECAALRRSGIGECHLNIRQSAWNIQPNIRDPKHRTFKVPISNGLADMLRRFGRERGPLLFPGSDGTTPIGRRSFLMRVSAYKAGVER